jgi:galactonate dehydratase
MVSPIATMASVQVCANIPNFLVLEFQLGDVQWRDSILDSPLPLKNGQIEVSNKPGLGVSLNKKELEKYIVQ